MQRKGHDVTDAKHALHGARGVVEHADDALKGGGRGVLVRLEATVDLGQHAEALQALVDGLVEPVIVTEQPVRMKRPDTLCIGGAFLRWPRVRIGIGRPKCTVVLSGGEGTLVDRPKERSGLLLRCRKCEMTRVFRDRQRQGAKCKGRPLGRTSVTL